MGDDAFGVYISPKFRISSLLTKQQEEEKIAASKPLTTPKIDLRNPADSHPIQETNPAQKLSSKEQRDELLANRKSTPRPSILLLNKLGEGKMIELDLDSLKKLSLKNRRASRLSIKIANQIIKEERRKSILASYANNTLELSPSVDVQDQKKVNRDREDSISEDSDDSDCESSVSSL